MENPALQENKMATAPVGKLLLRMAIPLMLSMIMEALYNVVDSLFIARVGEDALTALTLAFPIQLLVISITVGTGVGVNAVLSRKLGEKDREGASRSAMNGIFLAFLTYLIFLIFGLFFVRAYFRGQTSDAAISGYGVDYLSICMILSFGSVGQIMFQRLLQSTGRTFLSMASQMIGAVINIILDPILIFGYFGMPALGITGAAIATVTGQIVAFGFAIYFNLRKNDDLTFKFRGFRPDWPMIGGIYRVGGPAIVMQSLNSIQALGVNMVLIGVSSTAVAAFGVYSRIQNFVFMPAFGLTNAAIAIIAFNYGARHRRRITGTMKYAFLYAACLLAAGMVLLLTMAEPLMRMFDPSPELMSIGVTAMRTISLSYLFVAFTLVAQGIYQALGNGSYSLIITLMRVVVVLLPVLYIFSRTMPLDQAWWAFVLAEGSSAVVAVFLLRRIYRRKVAVIPEGEGPLAGPDAVPERA